MGILVPQAGKSLFPTVEPGLTQTDQQSSQGSQLSGPYRDDFNLGALRVPVLHTP